MIVGAGVRRWCVLCSADSRDWSIAWPFFYQHPTKPKARGISIRLDLLPMRSIGAMYSFHHGKERFLDGPPRIEIFHVVDLRSSQWREKNGITQEDAEARIDAAVDLIFRSRTIYAVHSSIDGAHFDREADGLLFRLNDHRRAPINFVKDYPSFHGYIYLVLSACSLKPTAEKVDFIIEKKREVFPAMHDFHQGMSESFRNYGLPRLADLIGELIPGDKKRIPLQAADLLCWHIQRHFAHARNPSISYSDIDRQRLDKLTKLGVGHVWESEMVEELCKSLFEDWRQLNEVEGVREIQSDNEYDPPSRSKSGESCDGSGEEG